MKKKNIFLIKFTVVAAMIGFFSPSVSIQPPIQSINAYSSPTPLHFNLSLLNKAEARPRAATSRNVSGNRSRGNVSGNRSSRNVNRNRDINRNSNVNVNRNVNVNNRYYGGYHHYGYYGGRAIVGFTAGLVIGSMVAASTMPATCTTVVANGISYRRCGSSYYQPFYQGDTLVYKVVDSPY